MQHVKLEYSKVVFFLSDYFKMTSSKSNEDKEAGFKTELDRFMTNIIWYFLTSATGSQT